MGAKDRAKAVVGAHVMLIVWGVSIMIRAAAIEDTSERYAMWAVEGVILGALVVSIVVSIVRMRGK